jgi:hypothetical protein
MTDQLREIVIEKESAVFRLDANGRWHNQHGRFQHKKVIDYFHSCIKKDRHGFYLTQQKEDCIEKVYFPYEETAFFVFDVIVGDEIMLVLNTKERLTLDPGQLCIKTDNLYLRNGADIIKFTDRSMMKIAAFMEDRAGGYDFVFQGKKYPILTVDSFGDNR